MSQGSLALGFHNECLALAKRLAITFDLLSGPCNLHDWQVGLGNSEKGAQVETVEKVANLDKSTKSRKSRNPTMSRRVRGHQLR